jgi:hypothetical protein
MSLFTLITRGRFGVPAVRAFFTAKEGLAAPLIILGLAAIASLVFLFWRSAQLDALREEHRVAQEALVAAEELQAQQERSSEVDMSVVTAFIEERDRLREEQTRARTAFIEGYLDFDPLIFRPEPVEAPQDTPVQEPPPVTERVVHVTPPPAARDDSLRVRYLTDGMWDTYCHADPDHANCPP